MGEQWKRIKEDKRYEVSDQGHIRYNFNGKFRMLNPWNVMGEYKAIDVRQNGKRKVVYIHRLVAQAFIPNPENKRCINHIDNNPSNNSVDNLEWCTHHENTAWMMKQNRGVEKKKVLATNIETGEKLVFDGIQSTKKSGFSPSCVCRCCKGRRNPNKRALTHKGYRWEYVS